MHAKRQGFATMDPAKQRAIARKGGQAAQAQGVGYRWTHAEALAAAQKGGAMTAARRRAQRKDRG